MALLGSLAASLTMAAESAKAPKSDAKKAAAEVAAPRLTIVEPIKDFGTIAKGEKLDWAFEVRNTGTSDLQIVAARPGCGCTVADFDKVIKPGQSGKVTAHIDTTAFAGPISKGVTLETNDPSTPTSQLTIHAIVKPYVEAYPAGFVRYNLLQGDADTQSVTLYSEEDEPFQITKIEVPAEWIKATYTKIDNAADLAPNVGRTGQAQYKINVTAGGPDAKIGPLAEKIHVITNSKHQPDYYISVSGVVRPTFRVEPSGVNFGEIAPDDAAATRQILLHSNDLKMPGNFVVTKAESSLPVVSAAVTPGEVKGDYQVTLHIAKDAKPGDLDGNVKIYTNDKVNPVITVPVKGTVKPIVSIPASTK
jgi:hypothetical protein